MKKVIAASIMAMALTTGASAGVTVGLGYAAGSSNAHEAPAVRVPIDFDFGLRVEPELGFGKNIWTTGVGVYYTFMKVEDVNLFAGGRFAYTDGKYDNGTSLQGLVGGEYFLVPNKFSIAAQVGLEGANGDLNNNEFGTVGAVIGHFFF